VGLADRPIGKKKRFSKRSEEVTYTVVADKDANA
jgi:hypothetical protein